MSAHPTPLSETKRTFFGHPYGLMTLFTTEMWERFSYYSMRAILLYFLIDVTTNDGLGLEKGIGEALTQVYSASVFLLAVIGGWVADRVWGPRRATLYGGIVIVIGHVLLALPIVVTSYLGIMFVALGTGLLKPNISTMVGALYYNDDPRRDGGFSIFYMGINIGSLVSPFAVAAARNWGGYHAGFSVAAIGMAVALILFIFGRKNLPADVDHVPNPLSAEEKKKVTLAVLGALVIVAILMSIYNRFTGVGIIVTVIDTLSLFSVLAPITYFIVMFKSPQVTSAERSRLAAFIPLFLAAMLFWMIFEQAASSMSSFAKDNTELNTGFVTINPEWFQSVNPIFIVALTPIFASFWSHWGSRIPTATKITIGIGLGGLSFIWLGVWAGVYSGVKAPWWVLFLTFIIQTVGELFLSPVGLAATTMLAPRAFKSQAMALWFLASASGQAIAAQTLKATANMSNTSVFISTGAVALIFTVILAALNPWIGRHIHTQEAK